MSVIHLLRLGFVLAFVAGATLVSPLSAQDVDDDAYAGQDAYYIDDGDDDAEDNGDDEEFSDRADDETTEAADLDDEPDPDEH
jgi:hypothetical protein